MSVISAGTRCVSFSTFLSCDLLEFPLTFLYTQHSFLPITSELMNDPSGCCIQAQKSFPLKKHPPLKPEIYACLTSLNAVEGGDLAA